MAKLRHAPVFVPSGTFVHKTFSLDGVSMFGQGPTSILLALVPEQSSIYLRQSGATLRNLTVKVKSSHRDSRNPAIYIDRADEFVVDSVIVEGGNAGGIFNFGGSNGRILDNEVSDTLADAIHNTYGSHDIIIIGNKIRHAGDDMIAVVSYLNERTSQNILIKNNDLANLENGRGISVVGGKDITIQGNKVARTNCCAGIYLADEAAWHTREVNNVVVRDNYLTENSGSTGHGAIMIFADRGSVRDVLLERNTVVSARHSSVTIIGAASNISLIDNRFVSPTEGDLTGDGPKVYCIGNTTDDLPMVAARCGALNRSGASGYALPVPINSGRRD